MSEIFIDKIYYNDLKRIETDVIAKQKNGRYTKFYKPLNAVVITNMTKKDYIDYWVRQYHNDAEKMKNIYDTCIDKFDYGLTDAQTMINLIINSKDSEKSKKDILKLFGIID